MNKAELIDSVAGKAELPKKAVNAALDAIMDVVMEAVSAGDKVTLVGFGTFERKERQARSGRNPSTGEEIQIPATKVATFSPGKIFKEEVAKKTA